MSRAVQNETKIGAWYDCVKCRNCGTLLPILEVLQKAPASGDVFHDVPCGSCGRKDDYRRSDFVRVQAQAPVKGPTVH